MYTVRLKAKYSFFNRPIFFQLRAFQFAIGGVYFTLAEHTVFIGYYKLLRAVRGRKRGLVHSPVNYADGSQYLTGGRYFAHRIFVSYIYYLLIGRDKCGILFIKQFLFHFAVELLGSTIPRKALFP